ncbi:hypothetical protein HG536_0H04960 [Torulaspora globosa]|uniref:superoxide dismutase n=1 Tax=Torulaspora globosa TaxID=48254 RepID=A0A7G3ZNN4_9SACH|nr:uncharacterized protein HG536_0H04960 [Torulaspora globosa]QLL35120.1 hypothetical protein HG536_0H04960 [Torulaspora globosa]
MMFQVKNICFTSLLATFVIGSAPVKTNSPTDVKYVARFENKIEGSIEFSSPNGSVLVNVNLSGLPASGGPFPYHIHLLPVPADGNCTGAGGHLNPYNGSEAATASADKEVGDLSGKHGRITDQSFTTSYIEQYISLNETDLAFIGNLSVVVHFSNSSRLACANITKVTTLIGSSETSSTLLTANGGKINTSGSTVFQ